MQNRFEFLEEDFPKLADYARKAEESLNIDNNICLLNLGRIAETITKILCQHNNIPDDDADELLRLGIIDENIYRKINALLEIEEEAANSEYNSEMACSRLMLTAEELCRWFVSDALESKFSFLADLFPENSPIPPLADLALYGREAEENLSPNTRYSLICLGDIGEAVVNFLLNAKAINLNPHDNDQSDKINILYREGIIDKEIRDILHNIRMARNDAVHSRYNSEEEGRDLIAQALPLCEWMFKFVMSPGDFIKGKIISVNENNIDVKTGRFQGIVEGEELDSAEIGKRKIFKITGIDGEKINLSLKEVYTNPWINAARRYEKYKIGQDLKVKVTRVEKDIGATVEICGTYETTEARIPENEYGDKKPNVHEEIKARVKWFNPSRYPYMILSIKDAPQEIKFARFCANASPEEIREKLSAVEDVNAKNKSGMTALMMAALHNPNPEAINILVEAGAKVNSVNYAGNTALILASMSNTPEVVKTLLEHDADISMTNGKNKSAHDYAVSNPRLEGSEVIRMLIIPPTDEEFLELCASGTPEEITEAITNGANLDAKDKNNNTTLMIAAEKNSAEAAEILLGLEIDINAHNKDGDTALTLAAALNPETVNVILEHKPQIDIANDKGYTALIAAARYNDFDIVREIFNAGADVNPVDKTGNNALMTACLSNSEETVNFLIEANSDCNITNSKGNNALMIAAKKQPVETIRELLQRTTDINARNDDGKTALIIASEFNNAEVVSAILEAHAELDLQDNDGETALMAAVRNDNDAENILKVLIKAGPNLQLRNNKDHRAVDIAKIKSSLKGSHALVLILNQHFLKLCKSGTPEEISEYVNSGVNVNIHSAKTLSAPLMFAVQYNTPEAVRILLDTDADINAQDARGYTALILAAAYRDEEILSLLLDKEADVNIPDAKGYKALNYAAGNPKLKGTESLKRLKALTHN